MEGLTSAISIKKKIANIKKGIRQKLRSINEIDVNQQHLAEKSFKAIVAPLQEISKKLSDNKKMELDDDDDDDERKMPLQNKFKIDAKRNKIAHNGSRQNERETKSMQDEDDDDGGEEEAGGSQEEVREEEEEDLNKPDHTFDAYTIGESQYNSAESNNDDDGSDEGDEEQFGREDPGLDYNEPIASTSTPFTRGNAFLRMIESQMRASLSGSREYDNVYGPKYDSSLQSWHMGVASINFSNSHILINDDEESHALTPGLISLLFKRNPRMYTSRDLEKYKKILKATNVVTNIFDVSGGSRGKLQAKYLYIIEPLLRAEVENTRGKKRGKGLHSAEFKQVNFGRNKFEYVYWNDINELVARLALLFASHQVGNTSHRNEILSIIEELREADIIY